MTTTSLNGETAMTDEKPASRGDAPPTGVLRSTGRDRHEWFAALDAWGARDRSYAEIAGWLRDAHGLSAWWAQKLTVEYEQARGLRAPGVRRDGTFEVTASKAIGASPEVALAALTDPEVRARWLPGQVVRERAVDPGRQARFDWGEAGERVTVSVEALAGGRTTVAIQHARLPDPTAAKAARTAWKDRLAALKTLLETPR